MFPPDILNAVKLSLEYIGLVKNNEMKENEWDSLKTIINSFLIQA